jgi:hypothetical protein
MPDSIRPIAFMVMPFGKRTVAPRSKKAPKEVDFDALWDHAIQPALKELEYLPVRADSDTGTVIIKDMLERLAFSDLVLADVSIPNGNVYYEIGIRQAAQEKGCILIGADWCKPLFDIDQMRRIGYPLPDGSIPEPDREKIRAVLIEKIPKFRDSVSPFHEYVKIKQTSTVFREQFESISHFQSEFREQLESISHFQSEVRAIRLEWDTIKRRQAVLDIIKSYTASYRSLPSIAIEIAILIRDNLTWEELETFITDLPESIRKTPFLEEQLLLAQSKKADGNHLATIAGIERMIVSDGDTPERRGIIGGRYKELWRVEKQMRKDNQIDDPTQPENAYLDAAIENYSHGMDLDFNEYYCSSNLPILLKSRGEDGDLDKANFAATLTVAAIQRKMLRGEEDEWARPTLLVAAFFSGVETKIKELLTLIRKENPSPWEIKTALNDISDAIELHADPALRNRLEEYKDSLVGLSA